MLRAIWRLILMPELVSIVEVGHESFLFNKTMPLKEMLKGKIGCEATTGLGSLCGFNYEMYMPHERHHGDATI